MKEELKSLIWPVIITLIVYGLIIYIWPHTDLYKEHWEAARYKDFSYAAWLNSPMRDPNITERQIDEWFEKFEDKYGVSRDEFDASEIFKNY